MLITSVSFLSMMVFFFNSKTKESICAELYWAEAGMAARKISAIIKLFSINQSWEKKMVFTFVNSRIPSSESSLPNPDFFTPPKGSFGSERTNSLKNTAPSSNKWTWFAYFSTFDVQMETPNPKEVKLLNVTASLNVLN